MNKDQNNSCSRCGSQWPKRYVAVAVIHSGVNSLSGKKKFKSSVAANLVFFFSDLGSCKCRHNFCKGY